MLRYSFKKFVSAMDCMDLATFSEHMYLLLLYNGSKSKKLILQEWILKVFGLNFTMEEELDFKYLNWPLSNVKI